MKTMKTNLFFFLLVGIFSLSQVFAQSPDIKIVGGMPANIEDYPYQVALFSIDEVGNISEFMCGGSIIDRYWVVTAAHCVLQNSHKKQRIVAAFSKLSEVDEAYVYEISDYIIHPEFDMNTVANDIALLRLAYPIDTANPGIKIIRLVSPEEEQLGLIAPGTMATITGWGTTQYMGEQPDQLQVGTLPIISVETANQWFAETSQGMNTVLESMLPAGYEEGGVSGCHGDSGGPLAVKDSSDNFVLAGITSWGNICGAPKQPAVYTRVPYFYHWIMENSQIDVNFEPSHDNFIELNILYINDKVYSCGNVPHIGEYLVVNTGREPLEKFDVTIKIGTDPANLLSSNTYTIEIDNPLPTGGSKRFPIELSGALENYGMYWVEVTISNPNGFEIALEKYTDNKYFELAKPNMLTLNLDFGNIFQVGWAIIDAESMEQIETKEYNFASSGNKIEEQICLGEGTYLFYIGGMGTYDFNLAIDADGTKYDLLWNEEQSFFHTTTFTIPFEPVYDIAVEKNDMCDYVVVCDLNEVSENLNLTLYNTGTLPIMNLKYKITYENSQSSETVTLANTIFAGSVYPIELNLDELAVGNNKIKIEVISYDNYEEETNLDDNSLTAEFQVELLPKFATLSIQTDENYWNYGWEIRDEVGNIVMSRYVESPYATEYDLCLPEGCYYFVPINNFDQVMNVDTAVVIRDISGQILLVVTGEEFVNENQFKFCNELTSVKDDIIVDNLSLYPNPVSNSINLSFSASNISKASISITNTLGNVLYLNEIQTTIGQNNKTIDISRLPVGVYSVNITINNSVISKQLVVIR